MKSRIECLSGEDHVARGREYWQMAKGRFHRERNKSSILPSFFNSETPGFIKDDNDLLERLNIL
jgi:hypothetical protein